MKTIPVPRRRSNGAPHLTTALSRIRRGRTAPVLAALALAMLAGPATAQLIIRSGTAADVAGLTPVRDQFRTDLGGGTTAGANGLFDDTVKQRREINWDGVPAARSAPFLLAADFFNVNSPRGAVFATPGSGFAVSSATTDAGAGQPAAARFGNIDPTYTDQFLGFSPQRLFTPVESNIMDVNFFLPGTTTPAGTRGFGVIFTGVQQADTTTLQFFDLNNSPLLLTSALAQAGPTGFSFLGGFMNNGLSTIGRVRITLGNAALGAGTLNGPGLRGFGFTDLVVMDDFLYGNPSLVPETSGVAGAVLISLGAGIYMTRRMRRQNRSAVR